MELLNQLEEGINQLLERLDLLEKQNLARRQQQEEDLERLVQENALLKERLDAEEKRTAEALERVELLIERISKHSARV